MARQTQSSLSGLDSVIKIAATIVGALTAIIGTVIAIATYFKPPPAPSEQTVTQSGNGIIAGHDVVINGRVADGKPQPVLSDDAIYQAGIVVGKVFGARRLPNDATRFEFREITNASQFNTSVPFIFGGVKMIFEKEENSATFVAGRNDNPIRFGVTARVLD
jgi:hypothetical protein